MLGSRFDPSKIDFHTAAMLTDSLPRCLHRPCLCQQRPQCSRLAEHRLQRARAAAACKPKRSRSCRVHAAQEQEADTDMSEEELEAKMQAFMRSQAEQEAGGIVAGSETAEVLGADEVSEEEAKQLCRDVRQAMRTLEAKRDMTLNEIKLIVAIEDPRSRERREALGIEENAGGVSRDEMAAALLDVIEGRVPKDRIALRELWRELSSWPFLQEDVAKIEEEAGSEADYAGVTRTGLPERVRPKVMKRDKNELPQGLADRLPEWVGFGALYGVTSVPVILLVAVITLFFFSSLR